MVRSTIKGAKKAAPTLKRRIFIPKIQNFLIFPLKHSNFTQKRPKRRLFLRDRRRDFFGHRRRQRLDPGLYARRSQTDYSASKYLGTLDSTCHRSFAIVRTYIYRRAPYHTCVRSHFQYGWLELPASQGYLGRSSPGVANLDPFSNFRP